MIENIGITYVTDWETKGEDATGLDPFVETLRTLGCRLEIVSELPSHLETIDLLILHPRTMIPEILESVRISKERYPTLKTIVISSAHGSDLFLQAIDVGVDKYLLKPLSAGAVLIVAQRLVRQCVYAKEAQRAFTHIQLMHAAISKTSFTAHLDHKGMIIEINHLLASRLGRPVEEIVGVHWFRFIARRFRVFLRALVNERLKAGEIYRGIIEFIDLHGDSVMVDTTLYAILDDNRQVDEIVFIGHDMSEMNRAIVSSMKRMIDHDTSPAVLYNYRYEPIAVNRNFAELGGYAGSDECFAAYKACDWFREEGENLVPILEHHKKPKKALEKIFALYRAGEFNSRAVLIRPDQDKRYFQLHTAEMPNPMIPDDHYHILYFVDVTDFERLKEEKLSDAKLMSVGRLAASITHEINTPITYIKGNLELLKLECDEKLPEAEGLFRPIEEGIERIQSIVASMYEFAGTGKEEMKPCNPYTTLVYALRIVMNRSRHIVPITINGELFSYETKYDRFEGCRTLGIATRLEQVWIIILNNALDEFEKGKIAYADRRLAIAFECDDARIRIKISDNAGGIPEGILPTIFDFAVGGEKKKSMGIGLNVAKAIIDKHGGKISVANRNRGAEFEVVLKTYQEKE
ncbi:MAG: ATP-binding protein [Sulfuricurvum sp.]|jgi:PAS domain S-box-containing protein|nr:ATP-binding protein [Sulfuricurvum sp.]